MFIIYKSFKKVKKIILNLYRYWFVLNIYYFKFIIGKHVINSAWKTLKLVNGKFNGDN